MSREVGEKIWFLHHEKAPARKSLVVRKFLTSKHYSDSAPHPYCRDLPALGLLSVSNMKLRLRGRLLYTTKEIHTESQEVIDTLTFEMFQ
jgi:hypothetical protein